MPDSLTFVSYENFMMMARIVGALAVGAAIGLERSFHGRPPASARMRWCAWPPRC